MKANSINRGVFSILLVIVMLSTCWVFTASNTDAATAGSYNVRVTFSQNGSVGNFSGNVGGKPDDAIGVVVRYKPNNGTGTSSNDGTKVNCTSSGTSYTIAGFPDLVYLCYDENRASGTRYAHLTKLEVKGTSQSTWTTLWSGDLQVASIMNPYGISVDSSGTIKKDWLGEDSECKSNSSSGGWSMPSINSISSMSGGTSSMNVPTNGSSATSSAFSATLYDNYSVSWYQDPDFSVTNHTGVSMDGAKLKLEPSANAASNYSVTVKASKGGKSTTKDVTIGVFKYTVKFYDVDFNGTKASTALKTQTDITYGNSATAPSNPAPKYTTTQHKTFKSWNGTYQTIKDGAQTRDIIATYNSAASHGSWKYSNLSENNVYHRKKCGTCAYYEDNTAKHEYGETTFQWDTDGKNITFTKTCTTSGCGHVWSQRVAATPSVKTPATCTAKGWTTYTASSPFEGDTLAAQTTDREDIAALGHNWNTPTFSAWTPTVTTGSTTATRTCSRCSASESEAAIMSHSTTKDETCTTDGVETWTATSPWTDGTTQTKTAARPALGHDFTKQDKTISGTLKSEADCEHDAVYYYVCSRCNTVGENSWVDDGTALGHNYVATVTPPTCTERGYTTYVCSHDASHTYVNNYVDALGHAWSEYTQVAAPTCTTVGSEQRTCSRCDLTEARDIAALGHDKVAVPSSPSDGVDAVGTVYFKCNNGCGTYWAAEYNAEKEEYDPSDTEYTSIKQAKNNSEPVPAPEFNSFVDDDEATFGPEGYAYETRGASLKIAAPYEYTDENTKQGMRFTASLHVPEGVEIGNSGTGNRITDFGFVYTQTQYVDDDANFIIGKPNMYTMSVVKNNAGKGAFNGSNWTGVTLHDNDDYDGQTLTYNLVLNVKARNWQEDYCARAFIKYSYNGFDYVVYDKETTNSSRSVAYIAQCVVDNVQGEPERVRNYCQSKILDHLV